MTGSATVRAAAPAERTAVTEVLAAAFQDDPVMIYIFPDPDDRRLRLPRLFAILHDGDGAHGACDVTSGLEAAALWRAPGQGTLSVVEKLQYGLPWLHAAGFALGRALTMSAASDAAHPDTPHWYLHILGCVPAQQGRGYGGALLRAGLARADAAGVVAYLETAQEANIGLYEHFGFRVTHEWQVPGGPKNWSLLREPV